MNYILAIFILLAGLTMQLRQAQTTKAPPISYQNAVYIQTIEHDGYKFVVARNSSGLSLIEHPDNRKKK